MGSRMRGDKGGAPLPPERSSSISHRHFDAPCSCIPSSHLRRVQLRGGLKVCKGACAERPRDRLRAAHAGGVGGQYPLKPGPCQQLLPPLYICSNRCLVTFNGEDSG